MTIDEINAVVRQACPFNKYECFLAEMGGCSVVSHWVRDHRADSFPPLLAPLSELRLEASRRGGRNGAAMRWLVL